MGGAPKLRKGRNRRAEQFGERDQKGQNKEENFLYFEKKEK